VRLRAVAEKLLDTAERKPPTPRDPPGIFPNGIGIVLHRLSGQSPISSHARSGHNIEPDGAPSPTPSPAILAGMAPIPPLGPSTFCKLPHDAMFAYGTERTCEPPCTLSPWGG
jgi:hypothetical protein